MSLENFKNRKIEWDTVNKNFDQSVQIVSGDVNSRTVTIMITDNGEPINLTGYSVKLAYKYVYNDISGFVMLTPTDAQNGEFSLTIPTEMTSPGSIKSNLILLNENLEQVIVSKSIKFISDDSTVTDLAQEVNSKIDDFTKLLLESMPQVMRSELNDLHAQTESNTSNIDLKANSSDLDNLQTSVTGQGVEISTKAEQSDLLITNQNVTTAQTTANQAKTDAQVAMTKATEAQANSLPLAGNAVSASKLTTSRKLGVSLQASAYQNFDGTADVTNIGVSGVLPIANGGTATSDGVINTIAYANSADGADGFTTVYPNLNLLNFNSGVTFGKYYGWAAGATSWSGYRAYFNKVKVTPNKQYTISANWSNTAWLNVYAFANESDTTAVARFGSINGLGTGSWDSNFVVAYTISNNMTFTVPANINYVVVSYASVSTDTLTLQALLNGKPKLELGSIATNWMPSASEVTTANYPKYVGFSNTIKPNKTNLDYKWLPMGLVSIDSATGLLKPAVIGVDYAQAHPVGSVISNSSNSASGYTTGTWQNIGSAVIGSATVYYWKRTA